MRITTWNVNGLRAALKKGFDEIVAKLEPDVILLQEVRALPEQLPAEWRDPEGWYVAWHPAEKKGYAGVAVWSRKPMSILGVGTDGPDPEGRVLRVRTGGVQLASVYLPSGSSGEERQAVKEDWMDRFRTWARPFLDADEPIVLAGDLNICPTADDIWNAKGNAKNSGFLPHERQWFADVLDDGWVDAQRAHVGEGPAPYSWWSNRGQARAKDRGWRIDHLLLNPAAEAKRKAVSTLREGGLTVSDHAPVSLDLKR